MDIRLGAKTASMSAMASPSCNLLVLPRQVPKLHLDLAASPADNLRMLDQLYFLNACITSNRVCFAVPAAQQIADVGQTVSTGRHGLQAVQQNRVGIGQILRSTAVEVQLIALSGNATP
jgi:hypothetical protein